MTNESAIGIGSTLWVVSTDGAITDAVKYCKSPETLADEVAALLHLNLPPVPTDKTEPKP